MPQNNLGAYGYPTGNDLINKIVQAIASWSTSENKWLPIDKTLHDSLKSYDPISIDAFLQHYANDEPFINAAKNEISSAVLSSNYEKSFSRGVKDKDGDLINWYRFLWDAIVAGQTVEEIADPEKPFLFNIITFNYDTSLERFLYTRVGKNKNIVDTSHRPVPFEERLIFKSTKKVYQALAEDFLLNRI